MSMRVRRMQSKLSHQASLLLLLDYYGICNVTSDYNVSFTILLISDYFIVTLCGR